MKNRTGRQVVTWKCGWIVFRRSLHHFRLLTQVWWIEKFQHFRSSQKAWRYKLSRYRKKMYVLFSIFVSTVFLCFFSRMFNAFILAEFFFHSVTFCSINHKSLHLFILLYLNVDWSPKFIVNTLKKIPSAIGRNPIRRHIRMFFFCKRVHSFTSNLNVYR